MRTPIKATGTEKNSKPTSDDVSSATSNTSDDDCVRRSSRKRTTSKWLDGMDTSFGTPKAKLKRWSGNRDNETPSLPSPRVTSKDVTLSSFNAKVKSLKSIVPPLVQRKARITEGKSHRDEHLTVESVHVIQAASSKDDDTEASELEEYLTNKSDAPFTISAQPVGVVREIVAGRESLAQQTTGSETVGNKSDAELSKDDSTRNQTVVSCGIVALSASPLDTVRVVQAAASGSCVPVHSKPSSQVSKTILSAGVTKPNASLFSDLQKLKSDSSTLVMNQTLEQLDSAKTVNVITEGDLQIVMDSGVESVSGQQQSDNIGADGSRIVIVEGKDIVEVNESGDIVANWIEMSACPSASVVNTSDVKTVETRPQGAVSLVDAKHAEEDAASAAVTLATMQVETSRAANMQAISSKLVQQSQNKGHNSKNVHVESITMPHSGLSEMAKIKTEPADSSDEVPALTNPSPSVNVSSILKTHFNSDQSASSGLTILTAAATANILPQEEMTATNMTQVSSHSVVSSHSETAAVQPYVVDISLPVSRDAAVLPDVLAQHPDTNVTQESTHCEVLQLLQDQPSDTQWEAVVMDPHAAGQQPLVINNPEAASEGALMEQQVYQSEMSNPKTTEHQGSPVKSNQEVVIETVNFNDLPDEVASIIKTYTIPSGGPDGTQDAGKKYKLFKVSQEDGQNLMETIEQGQKADAGARFIYGKDGECIKLPHSMLQRLQAPSEPLLKCSNCDYITDKRVNWYKHKKIHEGSRPYQCEMCDYKATTSSNLKRHRNTHTGVRMFACSVAECGAKFNQKIHLDRHIKYKHMVKTVSCQLCDYTCALENPDLKIHMLRKHAEKAELNKPEVLYTCGECDFETPSKKDLRQHMKFHNKGPELKLFCENCSFVTDCPSRLNRHLLVHTKEKPFKCGACEYRASQKEHVIRHMRAKHKLDVQNANQVVMKPLIEEVQNEQESVQKAPAVGEVDPGEVEMAPGLVETESMAQMDDASGDADETEESEKARNVLVSSEELGQYQVHSDGEFLIVSSIEDSTQVSSETGPVVEETGENGDLLEETEAEVVQVSLEYRDGEQGVVASAEQVVAEQVVTTSSPVVRALLTSGSEENMDLLMSRQSDTDTAHDSENEPKDSRTFCKKKYPKPDFSNLPKIFNCQYCSMRFAKLINLYKHIHGQHASVHPMPPEGTYACVVCDFKSVQKKALLIHMRRHNPEGDQEETPNMIYSCVLCQYCTPKRRNLYWHLKKKHKISLLVNKDGTAKCVVDEHGPVSIVSAPAVDGAVDMEGQQVALSVEEPQGSSVPKVVNVSDLAHSLIQPKATPSGGDSLEVEPLTVEVILNDLSTGSGVKVEDCVMTAEDEDAAVAIEGLQALAEQTIQTLPETFVCESGSGASAELEIDTNRQNIELSSEQVMQLSSGDFIEIDGEMYKVEFTDGDGAVVKPQ